MLNIYKVVIKYRQLAVVLLFASFTALGQAPKVFLTPEKPIVAEIKLDDRRDYLVRLRAGQFASVRVRQKTIGVYYAVFRPDGTLIEIADYNGVGFSETIAIDAKTTGDYRIQIGWDYGEPRSGSYEISLDTPEASAKTPSAKAAQLFASWYRTDAPGAVVAVVKDHKVLFNDARGLASVELKRPLNSKSIFELASVSKQFTAFAIAMLIDKGVVNIDDDIRKYLPELPDLGRRVTIGNLVYHSSGIRDWTYCFQLAGGEPEDVVTVDRILRFASAQKRLNFNPGDEFSYSNTGYNLLAVIVERATKQSFGDWTRINIFKPLGMNSTFFKSDFREAFFNEAASYASDLPPYKLKRNNTAAYGSSSLQSSLDDLVRWVKNFDEQKIGGANVYKLIASHGKLNNGDVLSYTFGNDYGEYRAVPMVQHLGLLLGYRTSIRRFPSQNLAVIFLSNDGNDATFNRAERIASLFLNDMKPETPPLMPAFPAVEGEKRSNVEFAEVYLGEYYAEELGAVFKVRSDRGALMFTIGRRPPIEFSPVAPDEFTSADRFAERVLFIRDKSGRVTGLEISNSSDRRIYFGKIAIISP